VAQNVAELALLQYEAALAGKPSNDNGLFGFIHLICIPCRGTECGGSCSAAVRGGAGWKALEGCRGVRRAVGAIGGGDREEGAGSAPLARGGGGSGVRAPDLQGAAQHLLLPRGPAPVADQKKGSGNKAVSQ